jgi:hypothetical protein
MASLPLPSFNSAIPTSIASALSRIYYSLATGVAAAPAQGTASPWRPPQWPASQSFTLTMTAQDPTTGNKTAYIFDAIPRAEHEQRAVVTLNPIQSGAAITDHAYIVPPTLTVEIKMSDSMQSFTLGQFADQPSRSVSAYQTLLAIQEQRLPVRVATRLRTYDQMLITEVRAEETKDNRYALKAWVTFTGILTASIELTSSTISFDVNPLNSVLPQTTAQTITGQVQTLPVAATVQAQNALVNAPSAGINHLAAVPQVSGAGSYTSTGLGGLNNMLSSLGIPGVP